MLFGQDGQNLRFSIRVMAMEDIPQVQAIDREAFPDDWPPPDFKRELQNTSSSYIVAVESGAWYPPPPPSRLSQLASRLKSLGAQPTPAAPQQRIVGFCGLWFLFDEAHIISIATASGFRGQGIGELLLAATVVRSAERGARFVTLEVRISNTVAQNLYRKFGFAQVGVRPGYYSSNNEDALVMTTEAITSASFQSRLQRIEQELAQRLAAPTGSR